MFLDHFNAPNGMSKVKKFFWGATLRDVRRAGNAKGGRSQGSGNWSGAWRGVPLADPLHAPLAPAAAHLSFINIERRLASVASFK